MTRRISPPAGVDTLIFDLDGTLVDSFPGIEHSALRAIETVLPGYAVPALRPFIGPPIREIFRRALTLTDEITLTKLEAAFRVNYDGGGWQRSVLYPGVHDLLLEASNLRVRLMVLTNKPARPTWLILEHLQIRNLFDAIATPDAPGAGFTRKAEGAAALRDRYSLRSERTMIIGDSLDDFEAAQICAFRFAAVRHGYGNVWQRTRPHPWDATLDRFGDLAKWFG